MMGRGRHGRRRDRPDAGGSWLRRQARGLLPDRNPLRRRSDRVEAYLLAGLLVAAAAGAPLAAEAASASAYAGALRLQHQQLATSFLVTAVLAQPAGTSDNGYTISVDVPARATWTSVSGKPRAGTILALAGSGKGTAVPVWTDLAGDLVSPPMTTAQVAGQGDAGATGAVAMVVALFFAGTGTTRYVLRRRRLAAWEADWLLTAPTWNRQSW